MKTIKLIFPLILCLGFYLNSYSQNPEADKLYKQALSKMDNEKDYNGAIKLLEDALKISPDNDDYKYEQALSYFLLGEFKSSIKILEKIIDSPNATPLYYQLLGNSYNRLNDIDKSNKIYQKGFDKFSNAGLLYTGQGINKFNRKEYNEALSWFEKGIEKDPNYASNYFYSSMLFSESTEKVWAVLYGEIGRIVEQKSPRSEKMGKSLYDIYKDGITIKDSTIGVSFTKTATISMDNLKSGNILPFANIVFEMDLLLSIIGEKQVSIEMLDRTRKKFIELYFSKNQSKDYPNILFEYHKKLIGLNYFDCYNYWLFYGGNPTEADAWIAKNKTRYDEFLTWFAKNPMELSKDKKFYRLQYN